MATIVLVLVVLSFLLAAAEGTSRVRRRRAREKQVQQAVRDPNGREAAVASLRREIEVLIDCGAGMPAQLFGKNAKTLELAEVRLQLALLLLIEDRPEEALEELAAIEPNDLPRHLQGALSLHAIEAHLRLSEWDAAERVLDGYSADGLNENGRALRANARAQIRLGRGDARSALRVLDEIDPVPEAVSPELQLTRARALAADGRAASEVWTLLAGLSRGTLELFVRRHREEPATQLARRILDGEGPYR